MRRMHFASRLTCLALLASLAGCTLDVAPASSPPDLEVAPLGTASLSGPTLRAALRAQVSGHARVGYKRARQVLLGGLDTHEGAVECLYTGARASSTFNIEHSWPQSLGASTEPARSDLHHLFVSTQAANSARSNHLYGETPCDQNGSCSWSRQGSELGRRAGGALVFEVRPARRGDVARAQFYFAVRYDKSIDAVVEGTLRAWHDADPPDADERARNDAIEALQHNRNPFVDDPDLVGRIDDF